MTKFKWYAHGHYEEHSSIMEGLKDVFISEANKETLAHNLRNKFYELEFEVEANEMTGEILKITPLNI